LRSPGTTPRCTFAPRLPVAARDVIDTMTFGDQGLITVMRAYAD
jgi:hypothetical protein